MEHLAGRGRAAGKHAECLIRMRPARTAGRRARVIGTTSGIEQESDERYIFIMKTTVDIPEHELEDAMRFTNAKTKRAAVVGAIEDFNRRMRMAELTRFAGTCADLITPEEIQAGRRKG